MGVRGEHKRYSRAVTRTRRWRALRWTILERDGFRCRKCGARGRLEIDHIEPVRLAPEKSFDPKNLQALCPRCHGEKTRTEVNLPQLDPRRQKWRHLLGEVTPIVTSEDR
ncbi:MAG: HNH endonuclease signature motif containing protein [Pseudomonadota bacterium]